LQQLAEVYFNIARVGAQGFLGGRLAEARGDQILKELLAETVGEPLEPTADGGFMNGQGLCDLAKCLAVEIVGREQKAVFRSDTPEGAGNGGGELGQVCRDGDCGRRLGTVEIVEGGFAMCAAVMIPESLDKGGAKPAQERAAAGVRGQRGTAFALNLAETVELG
jgi:hypothetical protein